MWSNINNSSVFERIVYIYHISRCFQSTISLSRKIIFGLIFFPVLLEIRSPQNRKESWNRIWIEFDYFLKTCFLSVSKMSISWLFWAFRKCQFHDVYWNLGTVVILRPLLSLLGWWTWVIWSEKRWEGSS